MAVKVDTQKEIIFGSSDPNVSRVLSKKEKDGELRKVAARIYTSNLIDSLENIVRRNLMDILALIRRNSAAVCNVRKEGSQTEILTKMDMSQLPM